MTGCGAGSPKRTTLLSGETFNKEPITSSLLLPLLRHALIYRNQESAGVTELAGDGGLPVPILHFVLFHFSYAPHGTGLGGYLQM